MAGDGSGVDEGGGAGVGEGVGVVGSFCVEGFSVAGGGEDHVGDGDCGEARGVDQGLCCDGCFLPGGGPDGDVPAGAARVEGFDVDDGAVEGADAAVVFEVAFQVLH